MIIDGFAYTDIPDISATYTIIQSRKSADHSTVDTQHCKKRGQMIFNVSKVD